MRFFAQPIKSHRIIFCQSCEQHVSHKESYWKIVRGFIHDHRFPSLLAAIEAMHVAGDRWYSSSLHPLWGSHVQKNFNSHPSDIATPMHIAEAKPVTATTAARKPCMPQARKKGLSKLSDDVGRMVKNMRSVQKQKAAAIAARKNMTKGMGYIHSFTTCLRVISQAKQRLPKQIDIDMACRQPVVILWSACKAPNPCNVVKHVPLLPSSPLLEDHS